MRFQQKCRMQSIY